MTDSPRPITRPAPTRRHTAARAGFSLVELMVVVVVMAVMAAMILPAMHGTMEAERLRGAGRQILDSLHLAYSQSITTRQPHRWHFDAATGRYQVERPDRQSSGGSPFVAVDGAPASQGMIDRRIRVDIQPNEAVMAFDLDEARPAPPLDEAPGADATEAIAFFPDGTAQAKEILLRDQEGFRQVLRVNPVTAQVTLVPTREEGGMRP